MRRKLPFGLSKPRAMQILILGLISPLMLVSFQNCTGFQSGITEYSETTLLSTGAGATVATPTPDPSATPDPAATPTPVPTATPAVVATPTPTPTPAAVTALPPAITGQNYHLTFDDEFQTLKISNSYPAVNDGSNWYMGPWNALNCCLSTTTSTPAYQYPLQGDGNGTKDTSPFYQVPGGGLDIRMDYFPNSMSGGQGMIYTGDISTVDATGKGFSQVYGYWEIKAKFPSGLGVWPAIWMLPANVAGTNTGWGEIDIQEGHSIANTPTTMAVTLHDWTNGSAPAWCNTAEPTTDAYHTYGMLWTEQTMTFYFDNNVVLTTPTPSVMKTPYYLILNLGLGSGWPAGVGITPFPQDMLIQYVRVYSL